jgi:hypothetical protein
MTFQNFIIQKNALNIHKIHKHTVFAFHIYGIINFPHNMHLITTKPAITWNLKCIKYRETIF